MGCISPGGAGGLPVRRKYTSFLLQMLALTFMPGERKPFDSEAVPARATFFRHVCLWLQTRPAKCVKRWPQMMVYVLFIEKLV